MTMRVIVFLAAVALATGCAKAPQRDASMATAVDPVAPSVLQVGAGAENPDGEYQIGATDLLKIVVFQVPDLSVEQARVDASGSIELPLIGAVRAVGLTPAELGSVIRTRLADRYLRNPQVTVTVSEASSQKVTVDGAVTKPGVYEMRGRTTLLQAVTMAEGPTRVADLSSVAVFRTIDSRRAVAVFDLTAIRQGRSEDPVLLGDDIVIVDSSRLNAALRDIVAVLPGLSVFAYF